MKGKRKRYFGITAFILAAMLYSESYSKNFPQDSSQDIIFQEITEEINVYPGRIDIDEEKGKIYSIIDVGTYQLKLDLISEPSVSFREGQPLNLEFYPAVNYSNFIERWTLEIYDARDVRKLNPLQVIERKRKLDSNNPISVTIDSGIIDSLNPITELMYVFKVYDDKGRMDETHPNTISIKRKGYEKFDIAADIKKEAEIKERVANFQDNRRVKNIVLMGANIKIIGSGLGNYKKVSINNYERDIDLEETFSYDNYLGAGDTVIPIELISHDGTRKKYDMEVNVPAKYNFLVGLADITIGKNSHSGNEDILNQNNLYNEDLFKTGRLAFYYKGLMNKYRITAHADTYEQDIENLFKDFTRRDPEYYYRKLEYDPIEFNYGDDSVLFSDVDSQGKMYLRLDWDKDSVLWGNYNTGFTGSKYGEYNRTLYGGRAEFNSIGNTKFGDSKYHLSLFGSQPDSVYAHDELLGTGGSFYYLSYRDIVVGSAKLSIEVKDPTTGRVLGRMELQEGTDYSINDIQGLIRLTRPLSILIPERLGTSIIQEQPLSGFLNYLVVDYEYYSRNIDFDSRVGGTRAKVWLGDHVGVGGTYVGTNAGEHEYQLKEGDLTLKASEGTYLRGEFAESKGTAVYEESISINGGFDFFDREVGYLRDQSGKAYLIEGSFAFRDIFDKSSSRDLITGWYDKKEAGFSSAGERTLLERENYGGTFEYQLTERLFTALGHEYYQESDGISVSKTRQSKGSLEYLVTSKFALSTEVLHTESEGLLVNDAGLNREGDNGKATLVGAKAEYRFSDNKKVYIKGQMTADKSDNYEDNNMGAIGAFIGITDRLALDGEVTSGTRGTGGDVGVTYSLNDKHDLYSKYSLLNDGNGNDGIFTIGQSAMINDRTRVYQENQFMRGYGGKGFTGGYGVDYQKNEHLWLGALYQGGELNVDSGSIKKESVTLQAKFEKKGFNMRNSLEYSRTRGEGNGYDMDSWGTANRFRKTIDDQYTIFGVGNYLEAKNRQTGERDARNMEFGVGLAYRPIWNDKLNFIGKYAYVYDLGSIGQINANFGEKAHVGSIDTVYEISQRWDIGFKYAYRKESVRVDRNSGPWFDSNLDLFAVRLNYKIVHKWELFGEYHWLRNITDDQIKHGAMAGIYRELTDNLQLGVGYNFTEFNDDLTRLDYRAKGWFINLIGKF